MFALVFMQAVTSYLSQDTHDDTVKANLLKYWGTVLFSMESLIKAATGGTDWEVVATPLKHAGWGYYVAFVAFIAFIVFALLNILTGVFIENVNQASERDFANITYEARRHSKEDVKALKLLFSAIDQDDNGAISLAE